MGEAKRWEQYWNQYRYTDPIAEELTRQFGAPFTLYNTGGGCICLEASLEGGVYVLVGCACGEPLHSHSGGRHGYGVGVYETDTGYTLAHAADYNATTGPLVAELTRKALSLVNQHTNDHYVLWQRYTDGTETEEQWLR